MKPVDLMRKFLLPCSLVAATGLYAQQADPGDDQVFDLSPFTVSAGDQVGYRATQTLAGTRIRTNLRDVGASLQVVTEEFLQDTNATDIAGVLIYTANTEVGGLAGNFYGGQNSRGSIIPELQRDNNSGGVTRVRGLAAADLTRDYFITDIAFDTYNTDAVTVQRGANSTLFGLGSPGGVVNANLIKADFNGNRGRLQFQTDQHGTQRFSLRSHQELIENRWSIFAAGLYSMQKFEQEEAWNKNRRVYLSTLWSPAPNLRIRGSIEYGKRWGAPPRMEPPNDLISPWFAAGKPTVATPQEGGAMWDGTGDIVAGHPNSWYIQPLGDARMGPMTVYSDPTRAGHDALGAQAWITPAWNTVDGTTRAMLSMRDIHTTIRLANQYPDGTSIPAGSAGFFSTGNVSGQLLDRSIFDYRKHLLDGGASQSMTDFRSYILNVEKTWWDDQLGVEVSAHRQDLKEGQFNQLRGSASAIGIGIDMNEFMGVASQDGTFDGDPVPNPNFGRPYIVGRAENALIDRDREDYRLTGFAQLRFNEWIENERLAMILGQLNVTGVASQQEYRANIRYSRDAPALNYPNQFSRPITADMVRVHHYHALPYNTGINPLTANSMSDLRGIAIGPIPFGSERTPYNRAPVNRDYRVWDPDTQTYKTVTTSTNTILHNNGMPSMFFARRDLIKTDSLVLVGQHYMLNDKLVLTGSWRQDDTWTYRTPAAPGFPGYPDARRNINDSNYVISSTPFASGSGQVRSFGFVAHSPEFINRRLPRGTDFSIHYSDSENFQPSGGRRSIYGDALPQITGETEEKGFTISTLEGRLIAKVNWYETGVYNRSFENNAIYAPQSILVGLAQQLTHPTNVANGWTAADAQAVLPPQGVIDLQGVQFDWANADASAFPDPGRTDTQDFVTDGIEIELFYNPTPNWTIMANLAKQETITSNSFPFVSRFLEEFVEPTWINSTFAQSYVINTAGETLAQVATNNIRNNVLRGKAQDGVPTFEQRKWRATISTQYSFNDRVAMLPQWFSGLTVGGSLRYEDELGIGFGVTQNEFGENVIDLNNRFTASSEIFIDVFARYEWELRTGNRMSLQMNIKDLTNHNGLIPVYANPDGSKVYRIMEGRLVSMSATLHF